MEHSNFVVQIEQLSRNMNSHFVPSWRLRNWFWPSNVHV